MVLGRILDVRVLRMTSGGYLLAVGVFGVGTVC